MAYEDERAVRDGAVTTSAILARDEVLRLVRPCHRHEIGFRSLRRRSDRFLTRWEPRRGAGDVPGSLTEFQRMIRRSGNGGSKRMFCERIRDGRLVGQVGITDLEPGPPLIGVIGYWIGRPFIRKGYGTRMVGLAMDHAFGSLGMEGIRADIQPRNEPSRRLVRGLGLRMEGYSPDFVEIDGERRDHEHWWLRKRDWIDGTKSSGHDVRSARDRSRPVGSISPEHLVPTGGLRLVQRGIGDLHQ